MEPEYEPLAIVEIITIDHFSTAWEAWPRHEGKQNAHTAWARALARSRISRDALLDHVLRFAAAYRENVAKQYTPYLATWLNQSRWEDDLPAPPEAQRRAPHRPNYMEGLDLLAQLRDESQKELH